MDELCHHGVIPTAPSFQDYSTLRPQLLTLGLTLILTKTGMAFPHPRLGIVSESNMAGSFTHQKLMEARTPMSTLVHREHCTCLYALLISSNVGICI